MLLIASLIGQKTGEFFDIHYSSVSPKSPPNISPIPNISVHQKMLTNLCKPRILRYLTCNDGCAFNISKHVTALMCSLTTAMCNGVCFLSFLELRSAPASARSSRISGSSRDAALCTARSPSLSCRNDRMLSWLCKQTN